MSKAFFMKCVIFYKSFFNLMLHVINKYNQCKLYNIQSALKFPFPYTKLAEHSEWIEHVQNVLLSCCHMLIKMYLFSVLLMSLKCDFAITTLPNLPYELKLVQPSHYVSFVLKTFNYLQSYFLCSSSYLRQNSWHDYIFTMYMLTLSHRR